MILPALVLATITIIGGPLCPDGHTVATESGGIFHGDNTITVDRWSCNGRDIELLPNDDCSARYVEPRKGEKPWDSGLCQDGVNYDVDPPMHYY